MQFTPHRLPEVRRTFPNSGMFVSGMANTARKNYPDLMVPLCDPRFASTGIVLVIWSRFLLKRLNPWWLSLGSVVGVTSSTPLHKARERRAQWPRAASECSHWIRARMTHHHPLRFVTRGGVSLFLKVLKSDQCTGNGPYFNKLLSITAFETLQIYLPHTINFDCFVV